VGELIDLLPLDYTDAVVVLGSAIIGLTAGVLGCFAVLRQRSLVGDALAHAALPGVAVAFLLTGAKDAGTLLVGAGVAGLVGALLVIAIERTRRIRPDAAIGVVLSSSFSLGIVLLTVIANGEDANQAGLERYLFGQAAGLLERDLLVMGALGLAGLAAVAVAFRLLKTALFDASFAGSIGLPVRTLEVGMTALLVIAVVVGIRAVGAILMVALLIVPTVAARQLTSRLSVLLPLAGVLGAGVGVAGGLISTAAAVPTGPVVVLVGVALAVACVLLAPGRGVLWRARRLVRDRRRAAAEGTLLDLETALHAGPPPTERELGVASGRPPRATRRALRDLERTGLLARERPAHGGGDAPRLHLTESGAAAAHAALERRELWTLWLEHGHRLTIGDAREPDPRDLRGSLGDQHVEHLLALARTDPQAVR
jgi:manganese/zinc/iron transport system permease protein